MNSQTAKKRSAITTNMVIAVLVLLAIVTGYNYFFAPFSELPQSLVETEQPTIAPSPEATVQDYRYMVESMTAEEKISQLLALPIDLDAYDASAAAVASDSSKPVAETAGLIDFIVGGGAPQEEKSAWGFVTLFGTKVDYELAQQAIMAYTNTQEDDLPIWTLVDHEGGTVQRLSGEGFTTLPSWREACSMDSEQRGELWQKSANELQKVGVDVVLAPMLDIAANHPVLKTRICSDDPETTAVAAGEFVATMQSFGIMSVIKHFPGIGQTKKDLHKSFDTVTVTQDDVELYKFILGAYPQTGVMVSHVGVDNQDESIPCSLSVSCVGQIHQLFADTILYSDALNMKAAGVDGGVAATAQKALEAGLTVLVFEPGVSESDLREVQTQLVGRYNDSYEFRELVNTAVELVLQHKLAK